MGQQSDWILMINEILADFLSNRLSSKACLIAAAAKQTCEILPSLSEPVVVVCGETVVSKYQAA